MKRLKQKGDKWIVVDLQADTVNEFKTRIAAENFISGGEIEDVVFEPVEPEVVEPQVVEPQVVETTMGEGRLYGFKT